MHIQVSGISREGLYRLSWVHPQTGFEVGKSTLVHCCIADKRLVFFCFVFLFGKFI